MENHAVDENTRRSERQKIMTEHAKEYFSENLASRINTLNKSKTEIDNEIKLYKQCTLREEKGECQKNILQLHGDLNKLLDDTLAFMERHECDVSDAARGPLALLTEEVTRKVNDVLQEMDNESHQKSETSGRSNRSKGRTSGARSNSSSTASAVKTRMKLEAARIRFQYANRDTEMKRQSAEVQEQAARLQAETERKRSEIAANQELLRIETEYAVAEAEYRAITEEESDSDGASIHSSFSLQHKRDERTQSYINENYQNKNNCSGNVVKQDQAHFRSVLTEKGTINANGVYANVPQGVNLGTSASTLFGAESGVSCSLVPKVNSNCLSASVATGGINAYQTNHVDTNVSQATAGLTVFPRTACTQSVVKQEQAYLQPASTKYGIAITNGIDARVSRGENLGISASTLFGSERGVSCNVVSNVNSIFLNPAQLTSSVAPGGMNANHTDNVATNVSQMHGVSIVANGVNPSHNVRNAYDNVTTSSHVDANTSEFSKYLVKKELLMTRFICFNDQPESFPVWKASFSGLLAELDATPREELDLLVKYLGPRSSVQAQSLRSANANDAKGAVTKIWARLEERYGRPEMVDSALKSKLSKFPRIANASDYHRLYELTDIMGEIESTKEDPRYSALLGLYDTSVGVNQVLVKLPYNIQQKWVDRASRYKQMHDVAYPPFCEFTSFLRDMSTRFNDPGLFIAPSAERPSTSYGKSHRQASDWSGQSYGVKHTSQSYGAKHTSQSYGPKHIGQSYGPKQFVNVQKTEICPTAKKKHSCPIHGPGHPLNACRVFRQKPVEERKKILRENKVCFRCCETDAHSFRNCKSDVECRVCKSSGHPTAMHIDPPSSSASHGGERFEQEPASCRREGPNEKEGIAAKCTTLCGDKFAGRSCAKTVLVNVFPKNHPERAVKVYAVHDDQSNKTLGSTALCDKLGISGEVHRYSLTSCAGVTTIHSRHATGLTVQSLDGSRSIEVPDLVECSVPNDRSEIPTPEVARRYPHLQSVADSIPPLTAESEIGLLIGRDVLEAHHVEEQIIGPKQLGWVIVGEVCLGNFHKPDHIGAFKTNLLNDCRPTIFTACDHNLTLKGGKDADDVGADVFKTTSQDERIGFSQDDQEFISIMENEMKQDEGGQWKAPLPFKSPRPRLQNNRALALKRARLLDISLKKNLTKCGHMVEFMQQILETSAAEVAPPLPVDTEVWYLPLFGVYHPKKPGKIRGVFDSSVQFEGTSLNSVLLSGPNFTNSLVGVLLRFRRDKIAIMSDVQQMFYSFLVKEDHRNYLRFIWYRNNDPDDDIIEYQMRVHVFGNTPSPAVATFGLRKTVADADEEVRTFVERDFYVDDGLTSCPTEAKAIGLVKRTKQILSKAKINLCKIASNSAEVMSAFPPEDLEKTLKTVDIFADDLPTQASLGLGWDLDKDAFVFTFHIPDKPFTKRGVISAVSSIFDPLGFLIPVTLAGRVLVREMTAAVEDWDQPLSQHWKQKWEEWKGSLDKLTRLDLPRMFTRSSLSLAESRKVHVFADASEKAISAVAYLVATKGSSVLSGFIMGKSKLAPAGGTTIPRLELCAAVLATDLADIVAKNLDIPCIDFTYHSDSRVVLGYISNRSRRFHTYVCNRVQSILKQSKPSQWCYVSTENNPADLGTRCLEPSENLQTSRWITGPDFLRSDLQDSTVVEGTFELIEPEKDKELRPEIHAKKTLVAEGMESRFEKFSSWRSLVSAFTLLKRFAQSHKKAQVPTILEERQKAETFLIRSVQKSVFETEVHSLENKHGVHTRSSIAALNPVLDDQGIMRVGGCIKRAPIASIEQHPIIVPKSHLALLLVRHFHEKAHHHGRLVTEALIRSSGYWIVGAKRLVSSLIHCCVFCRKLRGKLQTQQMGDLPEDRITPSPPFSAVGVDVFGPWPVVACRTRGGHAESKRWAVLFSCLCTRAVHIEVIEEMSSSAFINALRRFVALRGPVKEFRSDRGTNFVGAIDDINALGVCVEKDEFQKHLQDIAAVWRFNPPHASHMGGAWERLIGIARKILDAMLLNTHAQRLTHEVLCTFMCEVTAVMNSRPIAPISSDPSSPEIITPAMLLTQKVEPLPALTTSTNIKGIYESQWKYVQILSNTFWKHWRNGYLQSLQKRRKWTKEEPNVTVGDIVLLRDKEQPRNFWPMGLVERTFPSSADNKVRTVEVRVVKDGKATNYVRPIAELVLLVNSI